MDQRTRTITWLVNCEFFFISLNTILLCSCLIFCSARDTIEFGLRIQDNGETLVSAGERFELGFFTPNGSSDGRRYVGIWYHRLTPFTVVWVANRNNPLFNSNNGVFGIREDGNLHVVDKSTLKSYWSTEIETSLSLNRTVKLMDSGNLVLREGSQLGDSLWESFEHPTDTFLPGMEMDANLILTSCKDKDDPGIGEFTFSKKDDQEQENRFVINKKSTPYWQNGGNFVDSDEIPDTVVYMLSKFPITKSNQNSKFKIRPPQKQDYDYSRVVINYDGEIQYQTWINNTKGWDVVWSEPSDRNCSISNFCGNFGSCNPKNSSVCNCMPRFKQKFPEKWKSGDFSGGCIRETEICGKNETFLRLKVMKVGKPDSTWNQAKNETECKKECLHQCGCQAYSFETAESSTRRGDSSATTSSCFIWLGELHDLQESLAGGRNLSVRVGLSNLEISNHQPSEAESSGKRRPLPLIVVPTVTTLALLACTIISFIIWRRKMSKKQENRISIQRNKELLKLDTPRRIKHFIDSGEFEEDEKGIDVPFFDFESILAATGNFSDANKLGQGGYGPVYKGIFPGGQEIAVKRLSSVSGQGLQEFKNEVVLIAKLQHRNLVRLRGYCIEGDEKILLYEYMPNRSLDSFMFDNTQNVVLDWETRFNIILGIARGLLYLHQDSRLRIIHRDLKTSNILLDQEMNPKISDFGLARIVGGKQTEANTNRVVGTYGYMSPEYALEGIFSVKSDVFSFGVVLLEIISGKRNTRLIQCEQPLSLLGYAWRLWTENKVLDLLDPILHENCNEDQFMKCVKVGLLCVQEDPSERPTMSSIITMLDSESAAVPTPQQPAFVLRRGSNAVSSSSSKPETRPEITVTLEGR